MLHARLDLSRMKLDNCLLSEEGEHLDQLAVSPDVESLKEARPADRPAPRGARLRRGRVDDRARGSSTTPRAGRLGRDLLETQLA